MNLGALFELSLASLFLAVAVLKLPRAELLRRQLIETFGWPKRSSGVAARSVLLLELTLAAGLVVPATSKLAAGGAILWCLGAAAYWAFALPRGGEDCGCFGGFDPLRRLGPARRFLYIAPFAILGGLAVNSPSASFSLPGLPVAAAVLGASAAGAMLLYPTLGRETAAGAASDVVPAAPDDSLSRGRFLRLAGGAGLAVALLPALRKPAFAAECGSYRCERFDTICSCTSCASGYAAAGCYQLRCRTCYINGQANQQCYYVAPSYCYTYRCSCGWNRGSGCNYCYV